ncbi:MAG: MYXO-CTERM sorting domain-containing protein [Nannocystaceae bacterium]
MVMAGFSSDAGALMQPGGKIIPTTNSLQNLFNMLGEAISALDDAEITPQTFLPGCESAFEVLQRNAGYKNSFGWYNVTNTKPTLAELHQILSCNDNVGVKKTVDIKTDPAYLGGEVGFFEATGNCADVNNPGSILNVFFSETKWNPDANNMNPYIHLIIYESVKFPRTYYFAWEDLIQGGDDDFDDLTTSVSGIACFNGPPCQPFIDDKDLDNDGYCAAKDNCPDDANMSQADGDNDGFGDACDNCPNDPNPDQADSDKDGMGDACDMFDTTSGGDTDTDTDTGGTTDGVTTGGTDATTDATTGNTTDATTGNTTGNTTDATTGNTTEGTTGGSSGNSSETAGTTVSTNGTGDSNSGTGATDSGTGGSASGTSDSGTAGTAGTATGTATDVDSASGTSGESLDGGCGCRSDDPGAGGLGALALLGLGLGVRRRRRA